MFELLKTDTTTKARLGRLTTVTALWTLRKPDDYYDIAWRREPGGGAVLAGC